MSEDNTNIPDTEALTENLIPVEVQVPENEYVEEHGDEAVEPQENDEEDQVGAEVAEGGPAAEGVVEQKWPGWPGENVFRILVPAHKVGGIIGRKGEYIKKTCEETRARIKILDGPPGTNERAVSFSHFMFGYCIYRFLYYLLIDLFYFVNLCVIYVY